MLASVRQIWDHLRKKFLKQRLSHYHQQPPFPYLSSPFPTITRLIKSAAFQAFLCMARSVTHDHIPKRSVVGYLYQRSAWDPFHFSGKQNKYSKKKYWKAMNWWVVCSCRIGKPKRLKCACAARQGLSMKWDFNVGCCHSELKGSYWGAL